MGLTVIKQLNLAIFPFFTIHFSLVNMLNFFPPKISILIHLRSQDFMLKNFSQKKVKVTTKCLNHAKNLYRVVTPPKFSFFMYKSDKILQ